MPQTTHLMRVLLWCYLGKPTLLQRSERAGKGGAPPYRLFLIGRTPQTSWMLCYALRKRGLKCRTAMAAKRFADGTPHA